MPLRDLFFGFIFLVRNLYFRNFHSKCPGGLEFDLICMYLALGLVDVIVEFMFSTIQSTLSYVFLVGMNALPEDRLFRHFIQSS